MGWVTRLTGSRLREGWEKGPGNAHTVLWPRGSGSASRASEQCPSAQARVRSRQEAWRGGLGMLPGAQEEGLR